MTCPLLKTTIFLQKIFNLYDCSNLIMYKFQDSYKSPTFLIGYNISKEKYALELNDNF